MLDGGTHHGGTRASDWAPLEEIRYPMTRASCPQRVFLLITASFLLSAGWSQAATAKGGKKALKVFILAG